MEMYFAVPNKNYNFAIILTAIKLTAIKLLEHEILRQNKRIGNADTN